ncbi:hypothetical protein [Bacillus wiedmannii]|uniref:hypothetical protein n=1 Tax=Bacillus wiedmannii TaxID=1890302 RepID=UPI000CD9A86E|nr:hypothetical protein [Bacillus wiedmannii]MBG9828511.1 hypothetical protein [Bacillus wiedmannii]UOB95780.1 hypothetical protein BTI679_31240 [Bacillus wiedmannii]
MSLNNVAFGKHQQRFEQMSIYDFLQDGESQEVAPSETLPQVDEAQAVNYYVTDKDGNNVDIYPSSALDVKNTVKATDKALVSADPKFEVNQIVTVVNPYDDEHEDYDYMKPLEGKEVRVIEIRSAYRTNTRYYVVEYLDGLLLNGFFYEHELK